MEYVVPLIIVLVVVIAAVLATRILGRRGRATSPAGAAAAKTGTPSRRGREATREEAEEASARLTPEVHRVIYSLIAQNQVLNAVKEYRRATRLSLGESVAAIAALAQFPQPSPEQAKAEAALTVDDIINAAPQPAAVQEPAIVEQPAAGQEPAIVEEPAAVEALTPEVNAAPVAGSKYRYRAIVAHGDEVREVASTRLNEEIFSQIRALALAGDHDGAARLLCSHADIGVAEAREFVSMIEPNP
ncbi:hypothetical protein [Arthrobacter sp. HLT1-20]